MVEFIECERAEDGSRLRDYYAAIFDGTPLPALPWGDARFDCVLVSANHARTKELAADFATQVVRCSTDWVQTTGPDAELIHDLVDEASVRAGRQEQVGDGSPMTSCHQKAISPEQIAEVAHDCLGCSDFVLCLVVGSPVEYRRFVKCMRRELAC